MSFGLQYKLWYSF